MMRVARRMDAVSIPVGWRTGLAAAVGASALMLSELAAAAASAETTWLCKPGSKTQFSGGAGGELECGAAGNGVITGSLKIMGYAESELLTATNP